MDNKHSNASDTDSALSGKMHLAIEKIKRRIAGYLSKQSEQFSARQKKMGLLVFGLITGMISLTLIFRPISGNTKLPPITRPQFQRPLPRANPTLSTAEIEFLKKITATLDSMKVVDPRQYQRIMENHKQRIDSVRKLQKP